MVWYLYTEVPPRERVRGDAERKECLETVEQSPETERSIYGGEVQQGPTSIASTAGGGDKAAVFQYKTVVVKFVPTDGSYIRWQQSRGYMVRHGRHKVCSSSRRRRAEIQAERQAVQAAVYAGRQQVVRQQRSRAARRVCEKIVPAGRRYMRDTCPHHGIYASVSISRRRRLFICVSSCSQVKNYI